MHRLSRMARRTTGLLILGLLVACAPQTDLDRDLALTDAPKFGKFIWHDLITDDVAAAKAFYGPLMSWTFEDAARPGGGGEYTLIRSSSGRYIGGIVPLADPADGRDYSRWLSYYAVPDVDKAAAAAVAGGGEMLVHPRDLGSVGRVAAIRDPGGAVVGLATSRIGYPIDPLAFSPGDITWNELVAADASSAAAFYGEISGSEVRVEDRSGNPYLELHAEGRARAAVMVRPSDDIEPLWLTFFGARDTAATAGQAEALGANVLLPPTAEVRNGTISLLVDPTGAVFGLRKL